MKKKFLRNIVILIVSITASIVVYNYCFDFYGVLRRDASDIFFTPNSIYVKLNHIIHNNKKYDSFIFGSSRVGNIEVKNIKNGKYYNMFFLCGIPQEWLRSLQVMLENKIYIKNIIIALDEFSYKIVPDSRINMLNFIYYPTTLKDKIRFYLTYLFEKPGLTDLIKRYNEIAKLEIHYKFSDTGNYYRPREEREIEINPEKHRRKRMFKSTTEKIQGNRMAYLINEIDHILRICKEINIPVTVMINPIHINFYLNENINELNTFKRKLADITDFYDFCYLSPLMIDNYNFYDQFHYRPHVGNMIIARIFKYQNVFVPDWFGIKVTKKNIGKYTDILTKQLNYYQQTKKIKTITKKDLI